MVGHVNTLTVKANTTAQDLANTFGQDNARLYAKDTGNGIELYSRTKSSFSDKIQLTRGPDGTIMTKASAKKLLAEQTVKSLVDKGVSGRLDNLDQGPGKLDGKVMAKVRNLVGDLAATLPDRRNAAQMTTQAANIATKTDTLLTRLETVATGLANSTKPPPLPIPTTTNTVVPTGPTLTHGNQTLPSVTVGGQDYHPVRVLGEASNLVVLYQETNPTGPTPNSFAAKLSPPTTADKLAELNQEMIKEYTANTAFSTGSPHLSGFTDFVPLADGRIMLVGALLPNDDYEKLAKNLDQVTLPRGHTGPIPSGKITAEQRDTIVLTMVKDALEGLKQIHEGTVGGVHRDVKAQNIMIDGQGRGVVVDLGASVIGDVNRPAVHGTMPNMTYLSPDMVSVQDRVLQAIGTDKSTLSGDIKTSLTDVFKEINPGGRNGAEINKIMNSLAEDILNSASASYANATVGTEMDIWGLGLAMMEMATGTDPRTAFGLDQFSFIDDQADHMKKLPTNYDKVVTVGTEALGARTVTRGSGNTEVDTLLNELLALDPNNRPSAKDILDRTTGPLADPEVGSQEVRDLILAIKSGNPAKIDTARANL